MPKTGCSKVEAGLTVRERSNNACPTLDLLHYSLQWIVGSDLMPVDVGEGAVGQGLLYRLFDQFGSLAHFEKPQLD